MTGRREKDRIDLGRPRRSTIALAVAFLGLLVLYAWVRPPSAADTERQASSQQHVSKTRTHPTTGPSYPSRSATPTGTPSPTQTTGTPSTTPTGTQSPTATPTPSSPGSSSVSPSPTGSSTGPTGGPGPAVVPTSSP